MAYSYAELEYPEPRQYAQPQYAQPQYAPYPTPLVAQTRPSAPPSVHTVAIVHYLGGLFQIAAAATLTAFVADGAFAHATTFITPNQVGQLAYVGAAAIAVSGLITMVLGRKLQRGRQWARALVTIFTLLSIAATVVTTIHNGDLRTTTGLIFPALYLTLLNTRAARSWFRWHTW